MERDKRDPEKSRGTKAGSSSKYNPLLLLAPVFSRNALLLIGTSLCIALTLTPSYSIPDETYQLGDVVEHNIKAKHDFLVLDKEATEKKRKEAARAAPLVFDFDQQAVTRIEKKLKQAFDSMRHFLFSELYSSTGVLQPDRAIETHHFPKSQQAITAELRRLAFGRKKAFEESIGFTIPNSIYGILVEKEFSGDLRDRVNRWLEAVMKNGIIANRRLAARLQNQSVTYLIRKLPSKQEAIIPSPQYYKDLEDAMAYISTRRASEEGDPDELKAAAFLAIQLLEPNIVFNRVETGYRKGQAAQAVKPVYIQVKKDEMLVREGQRIGPEELLKLEAYRKSKPDQPRTTTFMAIFLFSLLYLYTIMHVSHQHLPAFQLEFKDDLFLAVLLLFLLMLSRSTSWVGESLGVNSAFLDSRSLTYAIPLAAGAMLSSVFFGITVSLLFSLTMSIYAGILFGNNFDFFIYFLVGSFIGAYGVTPCRNRMAPIKAGILVGCANLTLVLVDAMLKSQWAASAILLNGSLGLFAGVLAGILVTGFTPLAELLFGYTTDIKLLELASMDQPLLQELMVQAPGTYHHSIIVGNMVESAAKSIGANSLLAKVAAYYHDIGKIKKPLYFIENQFGCENRHEKLAPSMSSLILTSHVKEGVELAKKHRLGKPIRDIIRQHHGTSLISYFYQKALDAREKAQDSKGAELPPINIEDYRYPGPKPQTKEAGLVMLADVVEAACRSLSEPTPARIQGMVSRLINNIFTDGQLDDCELTLRDLHQIAKHFNQILATVHHKRIEYPSQNQRKLKGKQNGRDSSQRESRPDRDTRNTDRESGRKDLRRLGLH